MTFSLDQKTDAVLHRVCGLILSCDLPLPELAPVVAVEPNGTADIRVELSGRRVRHLRSIRWFKTGSPPSEALWLSTGKIEGGYLLRFHDLADFTVDAQGREIVCCPSPGTPVGTLRHLLLDQVMPLVLTLHGRHVLHATTVQTPLGVCAFIGPTGVGKSTLAASFLFAGYSVLSDDCLGLQEDSQRILAIPAYPGLRLWDDSLEAVCKHHHPSIPVAHYTSKRRPVLGNSPASFPTAPQPVARIYSLVRPDEQVASSPSIEPLSHRGAFVELLASSYRLDTTDRTALVRQFDFFERVVAEVPVHRLHLPTDFSALAASREAVFADLQSSSCARR